MGQPIYKKDGPGWLAKITSLALAGWFVWFVFTQTSWRAFRLYPFVLAPILVIWFPEMAAQICREKISAKTASLLGWIALVGLTLVPMFFIYLRRS